MTQRTDGLLLLGTAVGACAIILGLMFLSPLLVPWLGSNGAQTTVAVVTGLFVTMLVLPQVGRQVVSEEAMRELEAAEEKQDSTR